MTTLEQYNAAMKGEPDGSPIDRLCFFLSIALRGQDWIDVEQFIGDVSQQLVGRCHADGCRRSVCVGDEVTFDAEWLHDDGENLSAYAKAKAIYDRAEKRLNASQIALRITNEEHKCCSEDLIDLMKQLAAKDALLRHAKEALERAIEQMHFTEPWSAAEEDIVFAIEASTAIDKELK